MFEFNQARLACNTFFFFRVMHLLKSIDEKVVG